jgi:mRNA-degrading endonuclease toxin of MazEF toxin-antitoxin module
MPKADFCLLSVADRNRSWRSRESGMFAFAIALNDHQRDCVVLPVTLGGWQSRYAGFATALLGTACVTQGAAMYNQPRLFDLSSRGGRFVEDVSEDLLENALARLQPLFEGGAPG